jgi:hypothetical protein
MKGKMFIEEAVVRSRPTGGESIFDEDEVSTEEI